MGKLTMDRVLSLINDRLDYKPGWQFRAFPSFLNDVSVNVDIIYPAYDSDQEQARLGYPGGEYQVVQYHDIDFGELETEDDVAGELIQRIMLIELHEAREFMRRTDEDFRAPFHPHRPEGRRAWDKFMDESLWRMADRRGSQAAEALAEALAA